MTLVAAVDLGASGGRVMAGRVDGDTVELTPVLRFPNVCAKRDGHLRWDLTRLFAEVQAGLAKVPDAESIGIDTWGVDYGLLDGDGRLVDEPIAYRDGRTDAVIDEVHALVSPEALYASNGLQFLPFTTLYQLVADRHSDRWERAHRALLLPDLISFWLTGEAASELTNASTTGLLDVESKDWSTDLMTTLGIPLDLFPSIQAPAVLRGRTADGIPVTTVGSHDTASAVVGVPATTDRFAYLASGTWSLVGLELEHPVLTADARAANFTNETGVDGRTRFLRNVGGLWLLQECLRTWDTDDLERLVADAARLPTGGPQIDVDDPAFIPPDAMPDRIATAAGTHLERAATVRCILDSLAAGYARTIDQAAELADTDVEVVHVVGGGSQNELLCQLTADATGLPVLAGPVEATALGNVLVQARALGALPPSLDGIRRRLANALPLRRYDPT